MLRFNTYVKLIDKSLARMKWQIKSVSLAGLASSPAGSELRFEIQIWLDLGSSTPLYLSMYKMTYSLLYGKIYITCINYFLHCCNFMNINVIRAISFSLN